MQTITTQAQPTNGSGKRSGTHSTVCTAAPLVDLRSIRKAYRTPAGEFTALQNLNLAIAPGEFVAIVGRSGSGKSTLLNLLTGIDRPTAGEIFVAGAPVHAMSEDEIAIWRGKNVGIVFQFFQLLPTLTVLENVMLPMDFVNTRSARERRERGIELLQLVGVTDQAGKLPASLSGGQQQRAAIARALANDPPVLVADEPTGNLDSHTAEDVLTLFEKLACAGKTIVMVTHEREIASRVSRVITLADGAVIEDTAAFEPGARETEYAAG